MTVVELLLSLAAILLAAGLFTNAVEIVGARLNLGARSVVGRRIKQIMPADGWCAAPMRLDYHNGDARAYAEPLVGWALAEDDDAPVPPTRSRRGVGDGR